MKKLWVFGDSFSVEWGSESLYSKWKGYIPKIYSTIISETLGLELINTSVSGITNYDILDSVCENVHRIGENDIVIIGWTSKHRFRLSNTDTNKWDYWQPGLWDSNQKYGIGTTPNISKSTIDEILVNRMDSELYDKEILNWIELLKHTFKSNTFINWSWCNSEWHKGKYIYETIKEETNGLIDDLHFSENGQFQFSQWVFSKIEKGGFVNDLI